MVRQNSKPRERPTNKSEMEGLFDYMVSLQSASSFRIALHQPRQELQCYTRQLQALSNLQPIFVVDVQKLCISVRSKSEHVFF